MTLEENEVQRRKREYWGRWIMRKREDAGYRSQQSFADAAGVSRVQVQRWEAGEVRPDENRIAAISEALREVATYHETMEAAGYMSDTPPIVAQRYNRHTGEVEDIPDAELDKDAILQWVAENRRTLNNIERFLKRESVKKSED